MTQWLGVSLLESQTRDCKIKSHWEPFMKHLQEEPHISLQKLGTDWRRIQKVQIVCRLISNFHLHSFVKEDNWNEIQILYTRLTQTVSPRCVTCGLWSLPKSFVHCGYKNIILLFDMALFLNSYPYQDNFLHICQWWFAKLCKCSLHHLVQIW